MCGGVRDKDEMDAWSRFLVMAVTVEAEGNAGEVGSTCFSILFYQGLLGDFFSHTFALLKKKCRRTRSSILHFYQVEDISYKGRMAQCTMAKMAP